MADLRREVHQRIAQETKSLAGTEQSVDLSEVFFVFRSDLRGFRCSFQEPTRGTVVGAMEGDTRTDDERFRAYVLIRLVDGRCFEIQILRERPDTIFLIRDGVCLGTIVEEQRREILWGEYASQWKLMLGADEWGSITRPLVVSDGGGVEVTRRDGVFFHITFGTGSWLQDASPLVRGQASEEEIAFLFCCNIAFRTLVFEFRGGSAG